MNLFKKYLFINTMFACSDLESRKITRERAWEVDGWAETVFRTGMDNIFNFANSLNKFSYISH
jgi:hypothetical protein